MPFSTTGTSVGGSHDIMNAFLGCVGACALTQYGSLRDDLGLVSRPFPLRAAPMTSEAGSSHVESLRPFDVETRSSSSHSLLHNWELLWQTQRAHCARVSAKSNPDPCASACLASQLQGGRPACAESEHHCGRTSFLRCTDGSGPSAYGRCGSYPRAASSRMVERR
jgi:hypothetical protein